jgi:hypothetical protein
LDSTAEITAVGATSKCSYGGVRAGTIQAQQTDIFSYNTPNGPAFMWIGDRWQSSPDGIKGHDFTFWYPLVFDNTGNVTAMTWVDNFTIPVLPPTVN